MSSRFVYTELYEGQGFGNQLWAYAVTRCLAKKLDLEFAILSSSRFKGGVELNLDYGVKIDKSLGKAPNLSVLDSTDVVYFEKKLKDWLYDFDVSRYSDFSNLEFSGGLKIEGNFESEKYLEPYKIEVQDWFETPVFEDPSKTECIISFRGGEFRAHKDIALGRSYYLNAVEHLNKLTGQDLSFKIVTDDIKSATLVLPEFEVISDHADFFNEEFPSKKVIRDFSLLSRAKYLVLSNSSFSWWGAWVNKNPTIVIAPKYWARHNLRTSMWSTGDILTKGWRYLDSFGALYDYEDCILENQTIKQTFKRKVRSRKNYNWWK